MSFELMLTMAAVFGSIALLTGSALSFFVNREAPEAERLRQVSRGKPHANVLVAAPASLTESSTAIARRLASFVPKSPKEMGKVQKRLAKAGYHGLLPASIYALSELLLPIVLAGTALLLLGPRRGLLPAIVGGFLGYVTPGLWLHRKIMQRRKVIDNGLPDALDLFIVCLEAGSSLDQAILKASDELALAYPALSEELQMLISEVRAGKPRLEAFKNFAKRTGSDDVRALVAMLVQTDRFGTSVSQALRTHAEVSRTKRRQRAEERAAKVGVKLVFPLVFCLFPAFYVVTLGPAIIQFVRVFFGQVMNH